jgi:hypothetical protein
MVAEVEAVTGAVLTVNVAVLAPAGMVTLAGTVAALVLLARATCAPPVGAGPLSVTVPVEDCSPPTTLVGFRLSEETLTAGAGAGFTVRVADWLAPP